MAGPLGLGEGKWCGLRVAAQALSPKSDRALAGHYHLHLCQASSYNRLVLWLYEMIATKFQISSSECSSSEEQMQERHRFWRGFAIQPRVLRSSGEAQRVLAVGYALAPDKTFDLIV